METYNFETVLDFVDYVIDEYNEMIITDSDAIDISIVANYNECIKILNTLLKYSHMKLLNCEINEAEITGYNDAYVLTIDSDGYVWVQIANYGTSKNNPEGYVCCGADEIVFVHGDVNCKFVKKNKNVSRMNIFEIEDFDEDAEECDCFDCDADCTDCCEDKMCHEAEADKWFNFSSYSNDDDSTCSYSITFSNNDFGKNRFRDFLEKFKF